MSLKPKREQTDYGSTKHTHTPTCTVIQQTNKQQQFFFRSHIIGEFSLSCFSLPLASPLRGFEKCQFVEAPPRLLRSSQPSLQQAFRSFQVQMNKCLTEGLGFSRMPLSRVLSRGFRVKEGAMECWRESHALGRGLKMGEGPQLLQLDFQRYPLFQQVLKNDKVGCERLCLQRRAERFGFVF